MAEIDATLKATGTKSKNSAQGLRKPHSHRLSNIQQRNSGYISIIKL